MAHHALLHCMQPRAGRVVKQVRAREGEGDGAAGARWRGSPRAPRACPAHLQLHTAPLVGSWQMLSTLRARGPAAAKLPAQGLRWGQRATCACSMMALVRRRGPAAAVGLLSRTYAGGTKLVTATGRVTNVCSRAEVVALVRRWTSSKASSGSVKQNVAPKLDGWLGMTALEVADAASDPWTAFWMRVAVLLQFGCFLYILNNYGLSSTLCQGPSMMPTLNPAGDVVLVEHVTTTLGWLERGHVVVAKSPTDPKAVVCKRILGLPGDTVSAFSWDPPRGSALPDIAPGAHLIPRCHVTRDTRSSAPRKRTSLFQQARCGCKGTTFAIQQTRETTGPFLCRSSLGEFSSRYAGRR